MFVMNKMLQMIVMNVFVNMACVSPLNTCYVPYTPHGAAMAQRLAAGRLALSPVRDAAFHEF
jgi:hypothetical protein